MGEKEEVIISEFHFHLVLSLSKSQTVMETDIAVVVALNGGHTHQGCTDAIGKMCVNPP